MFFLVLPSVTYVWCRRLRIMGVAGDAGHQMVDRIERTRARVAIEPSGVASRSPLLGSRCLYWSISNP